MNGVTTRLAGVAMMAALSGCQCGDKRSEGEPRELAEATGVHRILIDRTEVKLDGLTVGDVRALAGEPEGGEVEGLGRALAARLRNEKGGAEENETKVMVEAGEAVPAGVVRRVVTTSLGAGVRSLVFVLPEGEKVRRLEIDPPGAEEALLRVELTPEETLVLDAGGKRWTIPNRGPRRDLKTLADVLYARKEAPDLQERDDLEIAVGAGVGYGALFAVLEAAAAAGFDRPRLVSP